MSEPVEFRNKRDSDYFQLKVLPEQVDLTEISAGIDPSQVCRTCRFDGNRLWDHRASEVAVHVSNGGSVEDLACAPDKHWDTFKVLQTTNWRGRITSLDTHSDIPTRAFVDTCGQQLRNDCAKCDRFVPRQVQIPYAPSGAKVHMISRQMPGGTMKTIPVASDGSTVRNWPVTVGGYCGIGVEGLRKPSGDVVFCDFVPRRKRVEASCGNCYYQERIGEHWMSEHLEVNENAALTPWEKEVALQDIGPDESVAMLLGLALFFKQTDPRGRRTIHTAKILESATMTNGVTKHKVLFDENLVMAWIAEGDDRFMLTMLGENSCYVEVLYPNHRMLGLVPPTRKPIYFWPEYPAATFVEHDNASLISPICVDCRQPSSTRPGKPCYYHTKAPYVDVWSRDIVFGKPNNTAGHWEIPNHAKLSLAERMVDGQPEPYVIDGNGNAPVAYSDSVANATVFRHHLDSLISLAKMRYGNRGRDAVLRQYYSVLSGLTKSRKLRTYRPSWLRISSMEPSKPICSHPDGINMRKVFQDSFGSERVDWDFDHGEFNTMVVEEELRVGYRQHQMTPQRLQEEIMSSDQANPNYDSSIGFVINRGGPLDEISPDEMTKSYSAIGGMYIDGEPVTTVAEFMDRLDELVTIGEAGEVERKITRRQQLFGYELSRGYYGSRKGSEKTSLPATDPGFVIFDIDDDPDQADRDDSWSCPDCNKRYAHEAIEDPYDPICTCGASLYKDHLRATSNPRAGGGIGNAFAMDTPATLEQRRLFSTVCPNWRLKTNDGTVIELADVDAPNLKGKVVSETSVVIGATVRKVGELTEEHKAANAKYKAALDAIIAKREAYAQDNPEATPQELIALFPPPTGIIYQIKAAGSLAKMGS